MFRRRFALTAACLVALAMGRASAGDSAAVRVSASAGRTLVIDVASEIDPVMAGFVLRVLDSARPDDLVVLDLNTFGGRIDAAVQIRDALLATKVKTAAFVHPRALSAGALIALATDTIVMSHAGTIGAATPVQLEGGKMMPVEAKVISYFRKEMKVTAETKGRRGDLAEAMVDPAVEIAGLDDKTTTLTLTTAEALKHGLAAFEAQSLDELCRRLGRPMPSSLQAKLSWAEKLARFLTEASVAQVLLTLGLLGLSVELYAPGHAVAGSVGALCLVAFFFGHSVSHLAGWESLVVFGVGAALVAAELLFFPGHGAVAAFGVLLVVAALVWAMVGAGRVPIGVSWSLGWLPSALTRVFGALLLTGGGMFVIARFLPRSRLGRALILEDTIGGGRDDGAGAGHDTRGRGHGGDGDGGGGDVQIGGRGVAETALRPTGKARIAGRRVDVVSSGDFVEPGTAVEVVAVDGARVVVRPHPQS
jgi:membrane-bound serine protease (ClpP class)